MVEDDLELLRAARLLEQRDGELGALLRQRLVLELELVLEPTQPPQLPAQLERRQDGVLARQADQRRADERAVGVDARARVVQRVVDALALALGAAAADVVRLGDAVAAVEQDLDDLVVVAVRRQDYGRDVGRERARRHAAQEALPTATGGRLTQYMLHSL